MTKKQRQVCANAFEFAREADEPILVARLGYTKHLEFYTAREWMDNPSHDNYFAIMMILPSGPIHFYDENFRP